MALDEARLRRLLERAWSAESSSKWTADSPATGQCAPTALVVQDLQGGRILKTRTNREWHFYNEIGGVRHDFTAGQFESTPPYRDLEASRAEAEMACTPSQYWALRERVGGIITMHYLLFYEVVAEYVERRKPFRNAHLEYAHRAHERGELLLAGALADPADGAVLLFEADTKEVPEGFARNDPYVVNGLVTSWTVRAWTTVVGGCSDMHA